ncbi:MAG TPA: type IV pilus secretin PilQ [Elusimicrobiales bacterium]|nr:type IV pilus secretin PilQ [Elusimicrobiales bacterium]
MKKYILSGLVLLFVSGIYAQNCVIQSITTTGDNINITLKSDSKPRYSSVSGMQKDQVAIRVFDCELSKTFTKATAGKTVYLKSVKVRKIKDPLQPIVEVIAELKKEADFDLTSDDESITLKFKYLAEQSVPEKLITKGRLGSKKQYIDIMESMPTTSFTVKAGLDVKIALTRMASMINVSLVFSRDVRGPLTINLNEVPFDEAFKTILSLRGLVVQQIGTKILKITTAAAIANERKNAPLITKFFALKYQNAKKIEKMIEEVIKAEGRKGKVGVDERSNALIVTDTSSGIEGISRLLNRIDTKPIMIAIEVRLVEVNKTEGFDLGVQWGAYGGASSSIGKQSGFNFFGSGNLSASSQAGLIGPLTSGIKTPFVDTTTNVYTALPNSSSAGGTGINFPSIANAITGGALRLGRITDTYTLDMTLSAAEQKGNVKILSAPKVATLNNQPARIDLVTRIPYLQTVIASSTPPLQTETVEWLEAGITLEVTPQVNADGRITMDIKPTVSQVASTIAPTAEEGGAPGLDQRSAETIVITRNGETVVIGGLLSELENEVIYKVPILGDIPILGWLFKKKHQNKQKIELLIFVTPTIVEE